jgi:hypothetical protein
MALPRGHVRYFHALLNLIIHMSFSSSQAELRIGEQLSDEVFRAGARIFCETTRNFHAPMHLFELN